MTENSDDFAVMLESFDGLGLNNVSIRRMAVKPLYDYFQKLAILVGTKICGLNKNALKTSHLKYRWESIRSCISFEGIEISDEWKTLITNISEVRDKVEHNDDYDPPQKKLVEIRKKAPEFAKWLLGVARTYAEKTPRYSFKQAFYRLLQEYVFDARGIIMQYGERAPHIARIGYLMEQEGLEYQNLPDLLKALNSTLNNFRDLEDVDRSDLENLIRTVRITSILQAREELLLKDSQCPSCGGKIVESQNWVGGTENNPEPDGFVYRVGCEKCEYEIHQEYFSI